MKTRLSAVSRTALCFAAPLGLGASALSCGGATSDAQKSVHDAGADGESRVDGGSGSDTGALEASGMDASDVLSPGCCNSPTDCGDFAFEPCVAHKCISAALSSGRCWDTSQCPAGARCAGVEVCACGASCQAADAPGTCVPDGDASPPDVAACFTGCSVPLAALEMPDKGGCFPTAAEATSPASIACPYQRITVSRCGAVIFVSETSFETHVDCYYAADSGALTGAYQFGSVVKTAGVIPASPMCTGTTVVCDHQRVDAGTD